MDLEELEIYKESIKQVSSEKLCEIIATHRYLNLFRDEAISAMEELATRRSNGDNFNYEVRIDELIATLPQYKIDLKGLMNKVPKII